jgi:hypothetical protein
MDDEQKEQARQLNLIGELDRLHRVNWELQHKVDGLTLLLNEQIASAQQLRDLIAKYSQQYVRMREALKPFARIAEDYEDWETEKITMIVLLYHLRAAAAAIRESGE